jgi:hypothetical protein
MLSFALSAEEHTFELNKRSLKKKVKGVKKVMKNAKKARCLRNYQNGVKLHRRTTCRQEAEAAIPEIGAMQTINQHLVDLAALQGAGEKADGLPAIELAPTFWGKYSTLPRAEELRMQELHQENVQDNKDNSRMFKDVFEKVMPDITMNTVARVDPSYYGNATDPIVEPPTSPYHDESSLCTVNSTECANLPELKSPYHDDSSLCTDSSAECANLPKRKTMSRYEEFVDEK